VREAGNTANQELCTNYLPFWLKKSILPRYPHNSMHDAHHVVQKMERLAIGKCCSWTLIRIAAV